MPDAIEFAPEEPMEDGVESSEIERVELDESTVEPEARVEAAGDFQEAEAIEGAFTEALGANAPPTEELAAAHEEQSTSGDADDRPTEEVVLELEGESKDDPHADEMMDFKPIPAEEVADRVLDQSTGTLDGQAVQLPISSVSKIDEFTAKLDVAEDEVGDFRIPSKHSPKIEPLPSRDPIGDPLETLGNTSDLEVTQTDEKPPFDPDARPTFATGDQEQNVAPSSTSEGSTVAGEVRAMVEDLSTSGDADDRPTEEIVTRLEGESKDDPHADELLDFKPIPAEELSPLPGREMLGFVDELEGGIAKAEVATHDLGQADIERKNISQQASESEPVGSALDFKPIPAEELGEGEAGQLDHGSSEVALDRKGDDKPVPTETGDDVALDRKGDDKLVPAETGDDVALDRKGDDGPAMDGKQGDLTPDHKVLDSDPGAEDGKIVGPSFREDMHLKIDASEPTFKVEGIESTTGYENLEPILGRAVTDPLFREQLAHDRDAALATYKLSEEEHHLLSQISPEQLEQMAEEIQTRFSESADPAKQAVDGLLLAELLWGTEIENKLDIGGATHKDSWKGE